MGPDIGVEFIHKTVGDAFQPRSTEWDCFELQTGSGTKEDANKRLVATRDEIPETLWQAYEADTDREASNKDTVAESSDHTSEGH